MEERSVAGPSGEHVVMPRGRVRSLSLAVGKQRFPILALDRDSCLVDAPRETVFRGYAEVFDGDRLAALCLILLAAPEGSSRRLIFKRFTEARAEPPRDFAD